MLVIFMHVEQDLPSTNERGTPMESHNFMKQNNSTEAHTSSMYATADETTVFSTPMASKSCNMKRHAQIQVKPITKSKGICMNSYFNVSWFELISISRGSSKNLSYCDSRCGHPV